MSGHQPPPLPPEPDWAPPPKEQAVWQPGDAFDAPDPARQAAVRTARWAGIAGLLTFGAASIPGSLITESVGNWVSLAVLIAGGVVTFIIARRAWRAGLPAGQVVATGCLTAVIAAALTIGIALVIGLGVCLVALNSSTR